MIALLAQATPPPAALASWLEVAMYLIVSAAAVVGLLVGIKQLREKPAETPQPLVVQGHVTYATTEDVSELAERLDTHISTTDTRFAAMSSASSSAREKIYMLIRSEVGGVHERINETVGLLRELKGKIELLTK